MGLSAKEFEKLLVQFCKQDLPKHFNVEHDIRDVGGESGNKRQIDSKITGKIGISDLLICGEAKNWNEPVGSEVIDAVVGKYFSGEIRANKVILFSNQCYTEPAITRAKLRGIELLEPFTEGNPIKQVPHIVAMGHIIQMIATISYNGKQHNIFSIDFDDYDIMKGDAKISFHDNFYRIAVSTLRGIQPKKIYDDFSKLKLEDHNVLYELKSQEGKRYNANFDIDATIFWDYFVEFLATGVLRHINTTRKVFVNMQESNDEIANKVLLSPTKLNYEIREDCIKNVVEKYDEHKFRMFLKDIKNSEPGIPLLSLV